jgi:hypothetical protein
MGSSFFKGIQGRGPKITDSGQNLAARALGAGQYAARSAGMGAQKDIAAAQAINKAGAGKPMKRSAAYPPGPKV